MHRLLLSALAALAVTAGSAIAQPSPNGVKAINPPGAPKAVGVWGVGARAGGAGASADASVSRRVVVSLADRKLALLENEPHRREIA